VQLPHYRVEFVGSVLRGVAILLRSGDMQDASGADQNAAGLPGGSLGLTWAGLAPADRASFAWRLLSFDHLVGAPKQRK
jgi:hypothetical protein